MRNAILNCLIVGSLMLSACRAPEEDGVEQVVGGGKADSPESPWPGDYHSIGNALPDGTFSAGRFSAGDIYSVIVFKTTTPGEWRGRVTIAPDSCGSRSCTASDVENATYSAQEQQIATITNDPARQYPSIHIVVHQGSENLDTRDFEYWLDSNGFLHMRASDQTRWQVLSGYYLDF
jgi:hypothetical protein